MKLSQNPTATPHLTTGSTTSSKFGSTTRSTTESTGSTNGSITNSTTLSTTTTTTDHTTIASGNAPSTLQVMPWLGHMELKTHMQIMYFFKFSAKNKILNNFYNHCELFHCLHEQDLSSLADRLVATVARWSRLAVFAGGLARGGDWWAGLSEVSQSHLI